MVNLSGQHPYTGIFSPTCMPRLAHFALGSDSNNQNLVETFAPILPQLETFAQLDTFVLDQQELAIGSFFGSFGNLGHLMLVNSRCFNYLFHPSLTFNLDSLHIQVKALVDYGTFALELAAIVKGKEHAVRVKRVVIYGSKAKVLEVVPSLDVGVFEWRTVDDLQWRDFDGK